MELVLPLLLLLIFPIGLLALLKTNMGIAYLAGCTGLVLLASLDPVVVTTASSVLPGEGEGYIRLSVVIISIIFAGLLFKHTVNGWKLLPHGFVALLLAAVLILLLPQATGLSWLQQLTETSLWRTVKEFQTLIITVGFSVSLLLIHVRQPHHHKKH